METWLEFFGRLHPVLVHVPIGSLVTLAVLELWNKARRRPAPTEARRLVAFVTAATAVGAAGAGWLLSSEGYGGDTLLWHRAFGIAFAIGFSVLGAAWCVPPELESAPRDPTFPLTRQTNPKRDSMVI